MRHLPAKPRFGFAAALVAALSLSAAPVKSQGPAAASPVPSATSAAGAAEPVIGVSRVGSAYTVEADVLAPGVPRKLAWDVLTDYDHMTAFMPDLHQSRVTRTSGDRLIVEQRGVARWGPLFRSFETVREVELRPYERVRTRALGGTVDRAETETRIADTPEGTRIRYRIDVVPGVWVPPLVTEAVIRHQVREQFRAIVDEMLRRQTAL